jgi:hypothetical protein
MNGKRAQIDDPMLSWAHIGSEYEEQGFVHELYLQLLPSVVSDSVMIPASYGVLSTPQSKHSIVAMQNTLYDILILRHLYKFSFGRKPLIVNNEEKNAKQTKSREKEISVIEEPKSAKVDKQANLTPPPAIIIPQAVHHRQPPNVQVQKKSQYFSKKHEEEFDDELSFSDDDDTSETVSEVVVKKKARKAPVNKTHVLKIITDKKRLDRM